MGNADECWKRWPRGSFAIMFVFYFESGYRNQLEKTEPLTLGRCSLFDKNAMQLVFGFQRDRGLGSISMVWVEGQPTGWSRLGGSFWG